MGKFDDFPTAPGSPTNGGVPLTGRFDDFPTLGEGTPTPEQTAAGRERDRQRRLAFEALQQAGFGRQLGAMSRHIVSSMPIIRSLPGVSGFANPQEGTEAQTDLTNYRTGLPIHSGISGAYGRTVPYASLGTVAPGLFSGLFPSAITGGAVEGIDAYGAGENVPSAVGRGMAGAIPGSLLGRAITPRGPGSAFSSRWNRAVDTASYWRGLERHGMPETADIARALSIARDTNTWSHLGDPGISTLRQELMDRLGSTRPPFTPIPTIPRAVDVGSGATLGVLANIASGGSIPHTLGAFGMGYVAPEAGRWIGNMGIRGLNRYLSSHPDAVAALQRYGTNQALSPEMRALLNAISSPNAQDQIPTDLPSVASSAETLLGH